MVKTKKFLIQEDLMTLEELIIDKDEFTLLTYICDNNLNYDNYFDYDGNYCIHTMMYDDMDYETFIIWEFEKC